MNNPAAKNILLIGGSLLAVYALFRATPAIVERQIERAREKRDRRKQREAAAEVTSALKKTYQNCRIIKGRRVCEVVNLDTMAKVINDAFKSNWFAEDEARAINEIKRLSPKPTRSQSGKTFNLMKELSLVYATKYRRNLKEDFIKYLSPRQWSQVSRWFQFV